MATVQVKTFKKDDAKKKLKPMSTKNDMSLDPGREPQHRVPGYRGSIHPEKKEMEEKDPKPWVWGPVNPGATNRAN